MANQIKNQNAYIFNAKSFNIESIYYFNFEFLISYYHTLEFGANIMYDISIENRK